MKFTFLILSSFFTVAAMADTFTCQVKEVIGFDNDLDCGTEELTDSIEPNRAALFQCGNQRLSLSLFGPKASATLLGSKGDALVLFGTIDRLNYVDLTRLDLPEIPARFQITIQSPHTWSRNRNFFAKCDRVGAAKEIEGYEVPPPSRRLRSGQF